MEEEKGFAILFDRKKISEYVEEFIPIKIVEGKYNKLDKWFLTDDNVGFPHMTEILSSGITYGCRFSYSSIKVEPSEKIIENVKREHWDYVTKYRFRRDIEKDNYIYAIRKDSPNIEDIFHDLDSDNVYKENSIYEDLTSPQSQKVYMMNSKKVTEFTPSKLYQEIRKSIKGQDEAIKKIVTAIWMNKAFPTLAKKNVLILGPSGTGKTSIVNKLGKILSIPVIEFTIPGVSESGYVGRSVDEIFLQLYHECDGNIPMMENSIVILDEFDKIARDKKSDSSKITSSSIQQELLKIVEGGNRIINLSDSNQSSNNEDDIIEIDTKNIIFIGVGAFSEMYEEDTKKGHAIGFGEQNRLDNHKSKKEVTQQDIIEYGFIRELAGRFPIIVELNKMTKDIIKEILLTSEDSELIGIINELKHRGIKLNNIDSLIDQIAEDAINKGTGARGILTTITNIFIDAMYYIADGTYSEISLRENIIKDNKDYTLKQKEIKKRIKIKGKI